MDGTINAYCVVSCWRHTAITRTIKKQLSPTWDQSFMFKGGITIYQASVVKVLQIIVNMQNISGMNSSSGFYRHLNWGKFFCNPHWISRLNSSKSQLSYEIKEHSCSLLNARLIFLPSRYYDKWKHKRCQELLALCYHYYLA